VQGDSVVSGGAGAGAHGRHVRLLCYLGWHWRKPVIQWWPSFEAEILTEVKFEMVCRNCGDRRVFQHLRYDPAFAEDGWFDV